MRKNKRNATPTYIKAIPFVVIILLAVVIASQSVASCNASRSLDSELAKGNTGYLKVVTTSAVPEQIINYDGMTLSFNPDLHIPNWVAWELTADEVAGDEPRSNNFAADSRIEGCATPDDYRNSGYDRGHMAPAGDMKWSPRAMEQSFYMTNICPQAKSLNTGSWKSLEEKCRLWAQADSAIIIVCGPVLSPAPTEFIGSTRVAVPQAFFKVVLAPYGKEPRGIGFIMPNGKVPGGMQKAAVSIDEVERITGHDFFSELPDDIENRVEAQCDFNKWSRIRP